MADTHTHTQACTHLLGESRRADVFKQWHCLTTEKKTCPAYVTQQRVLPNPNHKLERWTRIGWPKQNPARQNGDFGWNFTYFLLIFRLFSAYGTPSAVFKPTCLWNSPISAYFRLFSAYFPPKWYPILAINWSICCFSAHMFTVFAYFRPIFRSFSAYFPPDLLPIFRRSCLAGYAHFLRNPSFLTIY